MSDAQPQTRSRRPGARARAILGSPAILAAAFAVLCAAPFIFSAIGRPFLIDALLRTVILAVSAVSLNFLVFTAGLVSFGHAVFFGIGAYAVGICDYYGVSNGLLHLAAALGVSGPFALATGALALRTRGTHFIMITLAFSQVVFYILVGLSEYGGDDGLTIQNQSRFPFLNLGNRVTLYWVSLAVLFGQILFFTRLKRSRFGLVLASAKNNERRVLTSGLAVFRYRLVAYVISGMLASLSGVLSANLTSFITPEALGWIRSGDLLFVIALGGMGTALAPLIGSALFVFLEELLSALTIYWHFWFGAFLIGAAVLGIDRTRRALSRTDGAS